MSRIEIIQTRIATLDSRAVKLPPKTANRFYQSPEWQDLLAAIIEKRGRICEDPDCPKPHPRITRIFGDHIKEIQDGGARLDPANILLRCGASHSRKTARERARRAGINKGLGGG